MTLSLLRFIRPSAIDKSTQDARSSERYRRVALTAIASYAGKGTGVIVNLVTVPLALSYLGPEQYGLWLTIVSTIAMLGFADLGLSNGLLNTISEAFGRDDTSAARSYTATAFWLLSALALTLGVLFLLLYPHVWWPQLFNVSSPLAAAEAGPSAAIVFACFLLSMPLSVAQQVNRGYQEGFLNSIWMGVGSILGLGLVVLLISLRAPLPTLLLAVVGAPAAALFFNGVTLFGFRRPWLRPRPSSVTTDSARRLTGLGLDFFVLQIGVLILLSADNIIVAQSLGAEAVPEYSLPKTLFMLAPWILGMALEGLWPAYGEAIARGDASWVIATLKRSVIIVLASSIPLCTGLVVFAPQLLSAWLGPTIAPTVPLLLGLGLWAILLPSLNAVETFLSGTNFVRFRAGWTLMQALAGIILKVLLVQVAGLAGIAWGAVIASVLFGVVPYFLFVRSLAKTIPSSGRR